MLNRDDRNSETVAGSASSEVRARRESGHMIGYEVVVRLVNGEVIRGTFLDDYRHAIAI